MARPRVFISSTFYDLRHVRADLERFIREVGYEPVLYEKGQIPYGATEKLEDYCYREIELCDMLVALVGGRYGAGSHEYPYSISQMEVKTALSLGKQVYIFVDSSVKSEYATYLRNKGRKLEYSFVDNEKVYQFLEEIQSLPTNNQIAEFTGSQDIITHLREQWAGLFQRFLREEGRLREVSIIENLQSTAKTLNQLVTFLTEERQGQDATIAQILLTNHPFFQQLKQVTGAPYNVIVADRQELVAWLKIRGYTPVDEVGWDDEEYEEYLGGTKRPQKLIKIYRHIFDDAGKLKVYTPAQWKSEWVRASDYDDTIGVTDDDVPS